ncbi:DUF2569 domain-containing protein [Erwinia rhapontici]|uniref:DUF2569 domain-containing protein n=1 Tax=Erwinia rhapontici TaxID=55212 RepID=UPI003BA03488
MPVNSKPRLGGWLFVPLTWLVLVVMNMIMVLIIYGGGLIGPAFRSALTNLPSSALLLWGAFLLTTILMLSYSTWIIWMFCKRSPRLPRHYIIWLLINVLLALKAFLFAPVEDSAVVNSLLLALLAASVFVPYFKRSQRVKNTFIAP